MLIPEDSPLRKLPLSLSRKQVLVFDGIRYAAEMADVAYQRLFALLQTIAAQKDVEPSTQAIACAMLDAWSIVDAIHRLRNLISQTPGLSNTSWKRQFLDHTVDIAELRNCVQHQLGELNNLVNDAGQIWGYLS